MTVTDADAGQSYFVSHTESSGTDGTFVIDVDGNYKYTLNNLSNTVQSLAEGQEKTEQFTITSQDLTASQTLTFTVIGTNDAATFSGPTSGSVTEAGNGNDGGISRASGTLIATDVDDNQSGKFNAASGDTSYGTYSIDAGGNWAYELFINNDPVEALNSGDSLPDSFTVYSFDGTPQTIAITINGADDLPPPVANADVLWVTYNTDVIFSTRLLLKNDTDSDSTQLRVIAITGTSTGNEISLNPNGTFSFNSGTVGGTVSYPTTYTFDYTVANDSTGLTALGSATVRVVKVEQGSAVNLSNQNYVGGYLMSNYVSGGMGDDVILGGAGDDRLKGLGGIDAVSGGNGNDILSGGDGNDTLDGGDGNDTLDGGDGNDNLDGEDGNDTLYGEAGDDNLYGGLGTDTLVGGTGGDVLFGDYDDDTLDGGDENDLLDGGNGNDTLLGRDGNDFLIGGYGMDHLYGGAGTDKLYGGDDDDSLFGDDGTDTLDGGDGDDNLDGGDGDDNVDGGDGSDDLYGGAGADTLDGGAGNDFLFGDDGADTLDGGAGNDRLSGGAGNDTLDGGAGNDDLYGEDGRDYLNGEAGEDTLYGGAGEDTLFGGDGSDFLYGDDGADTIDGGAGNDRLTGGLGADQFVLRPDSSVDIIFDFSKTSGDQILIYKNDFLGFKDISIVSDGDGILFYDTNSGKFYYDSVQIGLIASAYVRDLTLDSFLISG
jgi:VCBS repeat-containing protein